MTNEQMKTVYNKQLELNNRILGERFGLNILELNEEQKQVWLLNFCRATTHELYELQDAILNEDDHNIVVECVDILHFIVSIGQILGLECNQCFSYDPLFEATRWLDCIMSEIEKNRNLINMLEDSVNWKWWGSKTVDWEYTKDVYQWLLSGFYSLVSNLGIKHDTLYDVYCQKNAINHQRQDKGYNLDTKTEDDNLSIKIGGTL